VAADVEGKADIVEEVVRIVGVDACRRRRFPRGDAPRKPSSRRAGRTRKAKRALAARGMVEAVTWSFISKPQAELFGGGERRAGAANPIAPIFRHAAEPHSRPRHRRAEERRPRLPDVALFEVGQIFKGDQPQDQLIAAAGVRRGCRKADGTAATGKRRRRPMLRRQGRCAARARAAGAPMQALQIVPAARPGFIPAAAARSRSARRTCSAISANCIRARSRRSTPKVRCGFRGDARQDSRAEGEADARQAVLELSPFQPVTRDFRVRGRRGGEAADIVRATQNVDKKLITAVSVFDVYEGKASSPARNRSPSQSRFNLVRRP
jgi:phenylalanyl-tRNA synthetase beta chain